MELECYVSYPRDGVDQIRSKLVQTEWMRLSGIIFRCKAFVYPNLYRFQSSITSMAAPAPSIQSTIPAHIRDHEKNEKKAKLAHVSTYPLEVCLWLPAIFSWIC